MVASLSKKQRAGSMHYQWSHWPCCALRSLSSEVSWFLFCPVEGQGASLILSSAVPRIYVRWDLKFRGFCVSKSKDRKPRLVSHSKFRSVKLRTIFSRLIFVCMYVDIWFFHLQCRSVKLRTICVLSKEKQAPSRRGMLRSKRRIVSPTGLARCDYVPAVKGQAALIAPLHSLTLVVCSTHTCWGCRTIFRVGARLSCKHVAGLCLSRLNHT